MKKVIIELYGIPRQLTKLREIEVEVEPEASLRDVVVRLGEKAPPLVGSVIAESGDRLLDPYSLNIDGRLFVQDLEMKPKDGDRIVLLSPAIGG